MHSLPNIDRCVRTRRTRSKWGPALKIFQGVPTDHPPKKWSTHMPTELYDTSLERQNQQLFGFKRLRTQHDLKQSQLRIGKQVVLCNKSLVKRTDHLGMTVLWCMQVDRLVKKGCKNRISYHVDGPQPYFLRCSWWQRVEAADQKFHFRIIGGRVAETKRDMSKILKSGGRVADRKDHRPKNLTGGWQGGRDRKRVVKNFKKWWQTAESESQELILFTHKQWGGRRQSLTNKQIFC